MSKNKGEVLQDPFLNVIRREHIPVAIYLVNGIKLQGQIESFDQYVVLLKNTVTQMVYKHAISTIVPGRPVSVLKADSESAVNADYPPSLPLVRNVDDKVEVAKGRAAFQVGM